MFNTRLLLEPTPWKCQSVVVIKWNENFMLKNQKIFNHLFVVVSIHKVYRKEQKLYQTIFYKPLTLVIRYVQE